MREAGSTERVRRWFIGSWAVLCVLKLVLAAHLPLFVDEAFYWQEGRHLAWAYSDLPGLTAWLARLGDALGQGTLALRLPFLLIGAALPWLVQRMTAREFGAEAGWQAGMLCLLLPLAGSLGLLALPDVPLLLASVLCLDAGLRLLREPDGLPASAQRAPAAAQGELALGLLLGGLTHYRFAAVIAVGFVALLLLPRGRHALRDPRLWLATAVGALAWLPLLLWNLRNADAGLHFQLVDRHPWRFGSDGVVLGLMQLLPVTPVLLLALALAAWRGLRDPRPAARYLALGGAAIVGGFLALGFFTDRERVSFHWPLPGFVALLPLLPALLAGWGSAWRRVTLVTTACGLLGVMGFFVLASVPDWRQRTAAHRLYPANFAGWEPLADAVRARLAKLPAGTPILAGDFKLAAELGFVLEDANIAVLDHPLNHHHGRAPQLALWGLQGDVTARRPALLVAAASHVPYRDLLAHYHALCGQVGPLPTPTVLNIDHGRQRFLLFDLPASPASAACTLPALAFVDAPAAGGTVATDFDVAGWAFKDGVGLTRVEVLLDGQVVAQARYGEPAPAVAGFWKISTDPHQPRVYFRGRVQGARPGVYWLGLRLHGADGSIEDWSEQRIVVR